MGVSFNNPFYIRQVKEDHFILCIKESHYCMTAGTYEKCLEMVTTFVKRYKTVDSLYNAVRSFDDKGRVGKVCFEERENWYQEGEWRQFDRDVRKAVREGAEYLEEHSLTKNIKRLLKKAPVKPKETPKPISKKESETPLKRVTIKIPKRPKVSIHAN